MAIRVILIDDAQDVHDAVVTALRTVEDIVLAGKSFRGEDAVQLCEIALPDLVLMDMVMPGIGGADTTRALVERFPNLKILAMSSYREYALIRAMLDSGAVGYVMKDAISDELVDIIRAAVQGNIVFSREIGQIILSPQNQGDFGLTKREMDVLKLVAEGKYDLEIAKQLDVSKRTVRFHVRNILRKMSVSNRLQAMVLAAKNNLV
jgi:NarL family two-component system response regulator LiaR